MAKSVVTITFVGNAAINDQVTITNSLALVVGDINEVFVSLRQGNNQATVGPSEFSTASNFYQALSIDSGNSGLYQITVSGNVVQIISLLSNAVFTLSNLIGAPNIEVLIENFVEEVPIEIEDVLFGANVSSVCDTIKASITTNVLAVQYTTNNVTTPNTFNPFIFVMNRGVNQLLTVEAANGSTAQMYIKSPVAMAAGAVNVAVLNTPTGANVTITLFDSYGITPEYSLDSVTWQANNLFTGIAPGEYTAYVRDQFGCMVNRIFSVPTFNPNLVTKCPTSYISESMSIRFKQNEVWDYNDIYKTDYNTLSCEEDVQTPFQYRQMFKPTNVVTTQFLSNYENIAVNILREDGVKMNVALNMVKEFVNLKDKRDAQATKLSNGKVGVYYTNGNLYDYVTNAVIGSYFLNGDVPDYGSVGNFIQLYGYGWFLIEDIIYNEVLNVDMLIITLNPATNDFYTIVASNWNQKNYNVFEFVIDFAPFVDEYIQVEILQSSPSFDDLNYLSEIIEVREFFKDTVEMIWFNTEDSNVFYSTGIKNIGNFPFSSFNASNDSEVVINKTTNNSVMVNSSSYDIKELLIEDVTTAIMKQVVQALLHKGLTINRVPYVASTVPSVEAVQSTNLYAITTPLLVSNPPYLSCQPSGAPSPTSEPA